VDDEAIGGLEGELAGAEGVGGEIDGITPIDEDGGFT